MTTTSNIRYFYTDAITVAFMRKHHGIKFEVFPTEEQATEYDSDKPWPWEDTYCFPNVEMIEDCLECIEKSSGKKIYIHPDSVSLLEPQVGDLIHIVRGFCSYYKNVADIATGGGNIPTGIWSDGEHWDITTKEPLHDWEIIQRNNTAFHWPESEPVHLSRGE